MPHLKPPSSPVVLAAFVAFRVVLRVLEPGGNNMKYSVLLAALGVLGAATAAAQQPIKIGVLYPLTGGGGRSRQGSPLKARLRNTSSCAGNRA